MPKKSSKPKDIVARSITLTDEKGTSRIFMGVQGDPPHSSICLFGDRERSIELSADSEGGLHVSLRNCTGKIVADLGVSPDDRVRLCLFDHRSGTRTEVGSDSTAGPHHITLHHHGRIHWTTKRKPLSRSRKRKTP